ncbi:tail fiber domain-containing protein [Bradyrhizobium sp. YCK136]|uniref:tail fiber domain-containing protein n=1 Tax=Bradyrhizobium sp. YCK136 TaxID=3351346 RepID=UPI0037C57B41
MSSNFPELVFSDDEDFTADRLNLAMQVLDQRLRSLEPFSPSWEQAVNDLRLVGLSRLNDAILPAYQRIQLLSTLGFLFAGSSSEVTLTQDMTATFVIDDETEKSLFTPTPFLALTRSSTIDDYAIAQLISYEQATGTLMVKVKSITGSPGPFTDWQIGACAASTIAAMAYFTQIDAARNAANVAKAATAADRVQTGLDRIQTGVDRNAAAQSAVAASASADRAGTWDPTNYALRSYVDGKIQALVGTAPATLDTLAEIAAQMQADESGFAALSTTVSGKLTATQNLNDLTDKAQARINLGVTFANPTSKSGLTAVNGSAVTYMRSDAAPAIDVSIAPTWTNKHIFQWNSGATYCINVQTYGGLTIYAPDQGSAFMTFHRGAYASQFGLDGDNYYRWGGWSDGAGGVRMYLSPGGLLYSAGYGASTTPVGGQVRAAGDIIYGLSDQRLKDDIQIIEDALEKIDQLDGVTWVQSDLAREVGAPVQDRRKAGLLAQQLETVLPEAVGLAPFDTNKLMKSRTGLNLLNIQYEQVSGLLVEGIKALKRKNDALEDRVARLEAIIEKLGV